MMKDHEQRPIDRKIPISAVNNAVATEEEEVAIPIEVIGDTVEEVEEALAVIEAELVNDRMDEILGVLPSLVQLKIFPTPCHRRRLTHRTLLTLKTHIHGRLHYSQ